MRLTLRGETWVLIIAGGIFAQTAPVVEVRPHATTRTKIVLSTSALWDIGGSRDDPANEFNHNNGFLTGVVLSNGGLAVIDDDKVRIFTADGRPKGTVGRFGRGPGEFARLNTICRTRGDTIVVADQSRISVISAKGEFVRHISPTPKSLPTLRACLNDGTFIVSRSGRESQGLLMQQLARVDLAGKTVTELGAIAANDYRQPNTWVEVRVVAVGNGYVVADPRTNVIRAFNSTGAPTGVMRLNDGKEGVERAAPVTLSPRARRGKPTDFAESSAHAEGKDPPSYARVLPGLNGELWLEDYSLQSNGTKVWTGIDSNGTIIGRLTIPSVKAQGARVPNPMRVLLGVGRQSMLFLTRDADGAAHFQKFGMHLVSF